MVWIEFALSTVVLVYVATQLAKYGDAIAIRTRLGGMFIGLLLIAGATSLPEVLTSISALNQNTPDLAAGNLLGSNTFNMVLLAVLDILFRQQRILRKAALKHALTGSLTIFLIGMVVFFMLADIDIQIGWVGLDSLALIAMYVLSIRLIQSNSRRVAAPPPQIIDPSVPSMRQSLAGFVLSALALIIVTPILVSSSNGIAEITGLGTTFIGTTLVALATSLPELVTTLAAVRIGADDMAIGNLFGSNMFNMFALGLTDIFYTQGRFLEAIDPSFLLVGMLGLLMTGLGLIGNLARLERRIFFIEVDALALLVLYGGGLWLLYMRGMTP